jgi:hypothetical protein
MIFGNRDARPLPPRQLFHAKTADADIGLDQTHFQGQLLVAAQEVQ